MSYVHVVCLLEVVVIQRDASRVRKNTFETVTGSRFRETVRGKFFVAGQIDIGDLIKSVLDFWKHVKPGQVGVTNTQSGALGIELAFQTNIQI